MRDIIQTVRKTDLFKTLSSALEAVDLSETLSGPGPFTFFAPTEKAFMKLPAQKYQEFLQNKWKLRQILASHVMADKVTMADIENMGLARMIDEKIYDISVENDGIMIDGAKIVRGDIVCSNGVIHGVDSLIDSER